MSYSYIDENYAGIKERIAAAAARAGRDAGEITLLAAVKSADVGEINYLHNALGVCDVGENRVQQLTERYGALDKDGLRVHFIGSLQTNKVKYIIDKVSLIHSLDSLRLAEEIDKQAKKRGLVMDVLVEINSGSEESKGGVSPEEAYELCDAIERLEGIRLCGFMTMAPRCETLEDYRPYFTATRRLCDEIWYEKLGRKEAPILSMGMSESFEMAVECGATMVRVGRGLFVK